ncbi:MAG: energy transducer TonB [Pseudomonadota bacterium]
MDYTSEHRGIPARQLTGFALVLAFHLALVYGLLHGLGHKIIQVIQDPLHVQIVEEIQPPPPPPAVPDMPRPPQMEAPQPFIPPPEVAVQTPQQQDTITATTTTAPESATISTSPAAIDTTSTGPIRVPAIVDSRACAKPPYPPASLRNEESGVVSLSLLVGVDGKVVDSRIEKSSGYRNLDNAARDGLSLCKFIPGTVDGKPEQFWTKLQYVWKLDK